MHFVQWTLKQNTALKNVSPLDVYLGRKEEILRKRAEKKILTMEHRRLYNKVLREHDRQPKNDSNNGSPLGGETLISLQRRVVKMSDLRRNITPDIR